MLYQKCVRFQDQTTFELRVQGCSLGISSGGARFSPTIQNFRLAAIFPRNFTKFGKFDISKKFPPGACPPDPTSVLRSQATLDRSPLASALDKDLDVHFEVEIFDPPLFQKSCIRPCLVLTLVAACHYFINVATFFISIFLI